jgi:hypothetical protein
MRNMSDFYRFLWPNHEKNTRFSIETLSSLGGNTAHFPLSERVMEGEWKLVIGGIHTPVGKRRISLKVSLMMP